MSEYSEKVKEHFHNPRNVGVIDAPSGVGKVGNAVCGDIMELYLKVENAVIVDAKFRTFGCGAAIATSSMVTELLKGKSISAARQISNRVVAEALGGLPPIKMHCSVLAEEALQRALNDYCSRQATGGVAGILPETPLTPPDADAGCLNCDEGRDPESGH